MSDLRKDFFNILLEKAKKDKSIHLLVGDLGFSFMEKFQKELPNQFTNVGIAEQNMVSMAVGMAIAGKKPYCYSNALFLASRANEQIRDDVCYNNLNVKLIGTSANDFLGFTHIQNPKDEASRLLSTFPKIKIFNPKYPKELRRALLYVGAAFLNI